ncbi:MAG: hypothetical protein QOF51_29 [Chloroflexota bacterium]|jgi:alkanesulfonate monooxygenase SsuD/methylene tetrahydromethanopterin reductase-like flavin-dependent oxidoreductase (luciferase family)|nr:hypothetical protein [Chloroflexota bacterium]
MDVTFGLALDFRSLMRRLDEVLAGYEALLHLAENQGFDSVSAGEGYPLRPAAGHLPSPLLALAALARSTTLRLGTGVILLPAWNALRLAYDAAVLDQITGGRFFLGVGVSTPALQRRFGVDPSSVGDRVDDMLAAVRALWAGANGYEGKTLSIDGGIGVLPVQPGGPPLLVGGSIRRSVERAATWGDGYIASTNYGFAKIAQQSQRYRAALMAHGRDAGAAQVMINRLTVVAETEQEARQVARTYVGAVLQGYARGGALGDDPNERNASPEELFERFDVDWCLVGTPAQVAERVRRYAEAGVTHIQVRVCPADIPSELAVRTVELLGREVLPQF